MRLVLWIPWAPTRRYSPATAVTTAHHRYIRSGHSTPQPTAAQHPRCTPSSQPRHELIGHPLPHTIQTVLLPANQQSDPGILGKPPGRPLAHLDNPKVAENQNPRVVTACLPGNQVNNANPQIEAALMGNRPTPAWPQQPKKTAQKITLGLADFAITRLKVQLLEESLFPNTRHFKTKHPGHKKAPEDKFHAQELQQPDLGEPTDTKAAGPNHPTKLTLEAISIHNKSKNHTPHF